MAHPRIILANSYLYDGSGGVLTDGSGLPLLSGNGGFLSRANGINSFILLTSSDATLTLYDIINVG